MRLGPAALARVLLSAAAVAIGNQNYFEYAHGFGSPGGWDMFLAGQAPAPEQYRVGVVWTAHWLSTHLGMKPAAALAGIDALCVLIALHVLVSVLAGTTVYQRAAGTLKWLAVAVLVLACSCYLALRNVPLKPETMAASMLLVLMLSVWQRRSIPAWLAVFGTVMLAEMLAFVRADVAVAACVGLIVVAAGPGAIGAMGRAAAVTAGLLGAAAAGGTQLWLMRVVFPQANYGPVHLWQLPYNLIRPLRWPYFVVFALPLVWTALQAIRRRSSGDRASMAMLAGGAIFAAMWVCFGIVGEVRVFVPFALALAPLTAEMAVLRASDDESDSQAGRAYS